MKLVQSDIRPRRDEAHPILTGKRFLKKSSSHVAILNRGASRRWREFPKAARRRLATCVGRFQGRTPPVGGSPTNAHPGLVAEPRLLQRLCGT